MRDGNELITNVRIANDKREVERRQHESELRDILLNELQKESVEAASKLNVISMKWLELETYKDPMSLHEGLEYQKRRITELMKQKDGVIEQLHEAVNKSDYRYYTDQDKQNADIYGLVERVDAQVEVMKRVYRDHLEILQKTIDNERHLFKCTQADKWQQLYDKREENEQNYMIKKREQTEFHESELKRVTIEHEELNRSTKIFLELDNDALQIELQNVKAEIMLNSEKLSYNFKVLRKRSDENIIIKGQQKRRLAKLSEIISTIRGKTTVVKKCGEEEIAKLTQEVMKFHSNILDLEVKAKSFALINDQKVKLRNIIFLLNSLFFNINIVFLCVVSHCLEYS